MKDQRQQDGENDALLDADRDDDEAVASATQNSSDANGKSRASFEVDQLDPIRKTTAERRSWRYCSGW